MQPTARPLCEFDSPNQSSLHLSLHQQFIPDYKFSWDNILVQNVWPSYLYMRIKHASTGYILCFSPIYLHTSRMNLEDFQFPHRFGGNDVDVASRISWPFIFNLLFAAIPSPLGLARLTVAFVLSWFGHLGEICPTPPQE